MYFNTMPYLIVGNSIFFLGLYVFFKNMRAKINILFLLACLSAATWLNANALANYYVGSHRVLFLLRTGFVGFILFPVFLHHYVIIFLNLKSKERWLLIPYLGGFLFALAAIFSSRFFGGYQLYFWGYTPTGKVIFSLFVIFYLWIYIRSNYILYAHYRETKKSSPLKYSQIRYLFGTFGFLPLAGVDFLSMAGFDFYASGYLFTALGLILIAITILRYRLVEIDIFVGKFVFFFIIGLMVAVSFVALGGILKTIVSYNVASIYALAIIILVLIFSFFKEKLQQLVNAFVYRNRYEYQKALKETTQALITKLDLNEICSFLIQMLAKNIGMLKASLFLENEEGNYFVKAGFALEAGLVSKYVINREAKIIKWLKENRTIFIKEEMEQKLTKSALKEIYGDLQRVSAEVIIPLFYRGNLSGVICLDHKRSGAIYNQADIDILETLAAQAAIAIEKAKLYTEAVSDSLTKLYYHRYFMRRLEEEMDRARRYSRHLSLVFVEIEGLKKVNEHYGHQEGDRLILEVARVIKNNIRLIDIAARFSGQILAIILPETREDGAFNVARRIKEDLGRVTSLAEQIRQIVAKQKLTLTGGEKVEINVSIGVGNFNGLEGRVTSEALLEMTKKALTRAKKLGGNRVIVYGSQVSS